METDHWNDPADGPAPSPTGRQQPDQNEDLADIDLQELASKVYALLKEELRIERERLGYSR